MKELNELYSQIGGMDEPILEFIYEQCIKDLNERKEDSLDRFQEEIEKIKVLKKIFEIEFDNINDFNRIAEEIEGIENDEEQLEELKLQLEKSFEIIKQSQLTLFDGYEEYQKRYEKLKNKTI